MNHDWLLMEELDGLYFYHLLAKGAAEHLKPGGFLAVEFGIGQATDILEMFQKSAQYEDSKSSKIMAV